jgi:pimeloyl-ACP methyl ester carboxylesterase
LIFLHSLGTNQFECLNFAPFLITQDLALVSFDFPGCGISEGDNIPLDGSGDQNATGCVKFLEKELGFTDFCLWGRSIGASIALQAASRSHIFKCVVADSGF